MKKYKLTYYYVESTGMTFSLLGNSLYELAIMAESLAWVDLLKLEKGFSNLNMNCFHYEEYDPAEKEWLDWVDPETYDDNIFEYLKRTSRTEYAKLMSYRKQCIRTLEKAQKNNQKTTNK